MSDSLAMMVGTGCSRLVRLVELQFLLKDLRLSCRVTSLVKLELFWKTFGKSGSTESFIINCISLRGEAIFSILAPLYKHVFGSIELLARSRFLDVCLAELLTRSKNSTKLYSTSGHALARLHVVAASGPSYLHQSYGLLPPSVHQS